MCGRDVHSWGYEIHFWFFSSAPVTTGYFVFHTYTAIQIPEEVF